MALGTKGWALLAVAGYLLSKKSAPAAKPATIDPSLPAPVFDVEEHTQPTSTAPVSVAQEQAPAAPVQVSVPQAVTQAPAPVVEDPRIAARLAVAQKYGADPSQLDLNQPEIEFWDGVAGIVRKQPNYIYKANQLFLPSPVATPIASTSLNAPKQSGGVVSIGPTYF